MRNQGLAEALSHTLGTGVDVNARRIFLVGAVDEDMAKHFQATFQVLDNTDGPIYVTLNSEGGSCDHGWAIYDAMRLSRNAVIIDVYGRAMSIAVAIMQGGDLRRISPEARLMVHEAALHVHGGSFKAKELYIEGDELRHLNDKYYRVLAERSGGKLHVEKIRELCAQDSYTDPHEFVKLGLADHVFTPTKKVEITQAAPTKRTAKKAAKPAKKKAKGKK